MEILNIQLIVDIVNSCDLQEILTLDDLDRDLTTCGLVSLNFIKMIVELEKEFTIEFPDDKLIMSEMNSINKIVEVIRQIETVKDN